MSERAFAETDRIAEVSLIEGDGPPPSDMIEQERRVAAFELSEESAFHMADAEGPYALTLAVKGAALEIAVAGVEPALTMPARELKGLVAEYAGLCEAYRDAVVHLPPAQIEALDQERREAHTEASERISEWLAPRVEMDAATARRLFTLICALGSDLKGG